MDVLSAAVLDHMVMPLVTAEIPEGTPRERLRADAMNIHRVFYEHPNVLGLVLTNR